MDRYSSEDFVELDEKFFSAIEAAKEYGGIDTPKYSFYSDECGNVFIYDKEFDEEYEVTDKNKRNAMLGSGLIGPVGAAIGAGEGNRLRAAGGSFLGGFGGALGGSMIARAISPNPLVRSLWSLAGGVAGGVLGTKHALESKQKSKKS
jgi:hypothetical protein